MRRGFQLESHQGKERGERDNKVKEISLIMEKQDTRAILSFELLY